MDPSDRASKGQAGGGGGIMVQGIFSSYTLGQLVPFVILF